MNKLLLVCIAAYAPFVFASTLTQNSELAQKCGACHGVDGNSPVPIFPNLAGQLQGYLSQQLKEFKLHERTDETMGSAVDPLSESDIRDLAEYYSEQKLTLSTSDESLDPALIAEGKRLYRRGITRMGLSCADCHGDDGQGEENRRSTGMGDFPRLAGQKYDYLV
jgi:cytochrome c553